MNGNSGLEGMIVGSKKVVRLGKPTLHVEVYENDQAAVLGSIELKKKAERQKNQYYFLIRATLVNFDVGAIGYNVFRRRD